MGWSWGAGGVGSPRTSWAERLHPEATISLGSMGQFTQQLPEGRVPTKTLQPILSIVNKAPLGKTPSSLTVINRGGKHTHIRPLTANHTAPGPGSQSPVLPALLSPHPVPTGPKRYQGARGLCRSPTAPLSAPHTDPAAARSRVEVSTFLFPISRSHSPTHKLLRSELPGLREG